MRRPVLILLVANLLLSLIAIGWLAAITLEPRHFFSEAYAQRGARGDPGPRGPQGPVGPPGPVGPDAQSAIDTLSGRVDDLEGYVQETDVADVESQVTDVESSVSDLQDFRDNLCSELGLDNGALYDLSLSAC